MGGEPPAPHAPPGLVFLVYIPQKIVIIRRETFNKENKMFLKNYIMANITNDFS